MIPLKKCFFYPRSIFKDPSTHGGNAHAATTKWLTVWLREGILELRRFNLMELSRQKTWRCQLFPMTVNAVRVGID